MTPEEFDEALKQACRKAFGWTCLLAALLLLVAGLIVYFTEG